MPRHLVAVAEAGAASVFSISAWLAAATGCDERCAPTTLHYPASISIKSASVAAGDRVRKAATSATSSGTAAFSQLAAVCRANRDASATARAPV